MASRPKSGRAESGSCWTCGAFTPAGQRLWAFIKTAVAFALCCAAINVSWWTYNIDDYPGCLGSGRGTKMGFHWSKLQCTGCFCDTRLGTSWRDWPDTDSLVESMDVTFGLFGTGLILILCSLTAMFPFACDYDAEEGQVSTLSSLARNKTLASVREYGLGMAFIVQGIAVVYFAVRFPDKFWSRLNHDSLVGCPAVTCSGFEGHAEVTYSGYTTTWKWEVGAGWAVAIAAAVVTLNAWLTLMAADRASAREEFLDPDADADVNVVAEPPPYSKIEEGNEKTWASDGVQESNPHDHWRQFGYQQEPVPQSHTWKGEGIVEQPKAPPPPYSGGRGLEEESDSDDAYEQFFRPSDDEKRPPPKKSKKAGSDPDQLQDYHCNYSEEEPLPKRVRDRDTPANDNGYDCIDIFCECLCGILYIESFRSN